MQNAKSEGKLATTNDWSFIADRLSGENWFLTGDSCGFADPILAAGMTLAHAGAREVAYTILEMDRGTQDAAWLRTSYDEGHRRRIGQHIRFADYWYSANAQFGELKEFTAQIAKDAGLDLSPDAAFQWLGTGGFVNDTFQGASIGTFSVAAVKQLAQIMTEGDATWEFCRYNEFRLDLAGAQERPFPQYEDGGVKPVRAYERDGKRLPLTGPFLSVIGALQRERELPRIVSYLRQSAPRFPGAHPDTGLMEALQALEAMLAEGWVKGKVDKRKPLGMTLTVEPESPMMQFER
jgi:hypothetical protein